MHELIDDLEDYAAVTIEFPFKVILNGETYVYINNMQELEEALEAAKNSCDEDDDNDYNDDDCEDCTTDKVKEAFANCNEWIVDKLYLNEAYLTEEYKNLIFTFNQDGTIKVDNNGTISEGTWTALGEAENIQVTVDIPDYVDFNGTWYLHEIKEDSGEKTVHLVFEGNHLRFKSQCSEDDDLRDVLGAEGSVWTVENYKNNEADETATFTGYQLYFYLDGIVKAKKDGVVIEGTWESKNEATVLLLDFSDAPVNAFNTEWMVASISETEVVLEAESKRLVIKRVSA